MAQTHTLDRLSKGVPPITRGAPKDRPAKRLYNVGEAALYLGRTERAVREMIYDGKLRYVKDGRRILVDVLDMDAWIDQSKTEFCY